MRLWQPIGLENPLRVQSIFFFRSNQTLAGVQSYLSVSWWEKTMAKKFCLNQSQVRFNNLSTWVPRLNPWLWVLTYASSPLPLQVLLSFDRSQQSKANHSTQIMFQATFFVHLRQVQSRSKYDSFWDQVSLVSIECWLTRPCFLIQRGGNAYPLNQLPGSTFSLVFAFCRDPSASLIIDLPFTSFNNSWAPRISGIVL